MVNVVLWAHKVEDEVGLGCEGISWLWCGREHDWRSELMESLNMSISRWSSDRFERGMETLKLDTPPLTTGMVIANRPHLLRS